ncbi:arsenate reductase ArsC [Flavobacteriaceae bacterium]|nr:arsenate reductase ArsC [Flavobacteriaceae bacterium]MDB2366240.1 arsenate reductase ArsC [Flavobacteriaceae bacterium]MDC0559967.1 arsenate reductase ArsC [Flavobacteriaceae bacterium]MDC0879466.1 arsenate reductase ArsC [Flavobacteriaceae bacterium]|tara:strand:- start:20 stop:433 length:414 start_codon:yes stop_codon:yes gene_type:complete
MKKILILCTGNSCRSQIAHGFLDHLTNNSVSVFSAGIEKHGLNKNAVKCMAEIGLDISDYESNHIDKYINESFDFIITVCDNANETCPVFQDRNAKKIHRNFNDPSKINNGLYNENFDLVRDEIKNFIIEFIKSELT